MMKITIIGGGNMGGAIAGGLASGRIVSAADITVTAKSDRTLEKIKGYDPAIRTMHDNREAVAGADLIIVAVKPWLIEEVLTEIRGGLDYTKQAVASVVAGVDFENLKRMLDNGSGVEPAMFRLIPNTAISLGESVTFIAASSQSGAARTEELAAMFRELGSVCVVPEAMMAAGTSLASCGIAFALRYIDASMKGGVQLGFSERDSLEIVLQTVRGALELLRRNGTLPQTEIDKVTTPGGITLKGLAAMQAAGFGEAVWAGLEKSR